MIINLIVWILSAIIEFVTLYFTGLYTTWYFDVIAIILLPVVFMVLLAILLIVLFIIGNFINANKGEVKPSKVAYWVTYQVNWVLVFLTSRIKVINKEAIPTDQRFLLVFNHRSNWDPMVLMATFIDKDLYFITKPSNFKIPIAGPFMRKSGFISINRENNKEGLKSILKAIDIVKQDKGSIAIAPEGTRNKTLETPMLEFHAGSFKIAYKAEVPIVVCTLKGCENIRKRFPRRTNIKINVLKVLPYEEYKEKDTVHLAEEIHDLMEEDIRKEN